MSLSRSEKQQLRRMAGDLRSADPQLVAMLAIFARLTAGEVLPERLRRPVPRAVRLTILAAAIIGRLAARTARAAGRARRLTAAGCAVVFRVLKRLVSVPLRARSRPAASMNADSSPGQMLAFEPSVKGSARSSGLLQPRASLLLDMFQ